MANGEMILLQGLSAAKKTLLAESQSDVLLLHAVDLDGIHSQKPIYTDMQNRSVSK
jgi:hypothetical protein